MHNFSVSQQALQSNALMLFQQTSLHQQQVLGDYVNGYHTMFGRNPTAQRMHDGLVRGACGGAAIGSALQSASNVPTPLRSTDASAMSRTTLSSHSDGRATDAGLVSRFLHGCFNVLCCGVEDDG